MRTYEEYVKALYAMKPNIWIGNEKVGRDDPRIKGGMQIIKESYDKAHDPEYEDLCTATSHITGKKINRFTHIHQSVDDLLKKQRMTRTLCHRVGGCIQRCMGIDALNAVSVVTYECDQALGTTYYQNFLNYMKMFQEKDLAASCASTDAKGDRSKRPSQQENPDAYLRVVETRANGDIVVRGAKQCITNTPYVDEIIAVPCRMMFPDDADYCVSFAIPADWDGVKLLARPAYSHIPNIPKEFIPKTMEIGDVETFIIFDDVVIPKERVFLNGQADPRQVPYAGFLALMFAHYHRHSYCGCKPAISEILASASALVAEYNGVENAKHVQDKISHILGTAELVFAAGESSAYHSEKASSGTQVPDEILTNAGRRHAGEQIYEEYKILADLAGGMMATLPFMETFFNEEVGELAFKYMQRNPRVKPENVVKCFKGIEVLGCSDFGGLMQVAGLHGGGSPQMETIALMGRYEIKELKKIAKYIFGIKKGLGKIERQENPVTPRKLLENYGKALKAQQKRAEK